MASTTVPLTQEHRVPCSLPLDEADLGLPNANWTKGLQAMSDWIWSGNLNPAAFPNNLARYFLQIPGVFEQQMNYSTTLIFDLPSYRNGIQVSGFVDRITRELVISYLAQTRHCWYSMTHHAVLGRHTAAQHGMSEDAFAVKWSRLTDFRDHPQSYSRIELAALTFAANFSSDPKRYADDAFSELKDALVEVFGRRFAEEGLWTHRLSEARRASGAALAAGVSGDARDESIRNAVKGASATPSDEEVDAFVNAAVVELAFLCLQFVALTGVFSGLNIPDEPFLADVMIDVLPREVVSRLNELNELGGDALQSLTPPAVSLNMDAVERGWLRVEPAALTGGRHCRVPLRGYEPAFSYTDRDRGLTVGGVQIGVYGWSFGAHFPGSLPYTLMHHPELARFEPPYSLPLLFNEDEWRNGTQTGGFVSRLLKEIVIQKVYKTIRTRYGIEHHTMFLYNAVRDEFGVGRWSAFPDGAPARREAESKASERAEAYAMYAHDPRLDSSGAFSQVEVAAIEWTNALLTRPHHAHEYEDELRRALDRENRSQVGTGERRLDTTPDIGRDRAFRRLLDHQIAELAMIIGHMDGLGRVLTILRLEAELPVRQKDGYFQDRLGIHDILGGLTSPRVATLNELFVNPKLAAKSLEITKPASEVVDAATAAQSGEF